MGRKGPQGIVGDRGGWGPQGRGGPQVHSLPPFGHNAAVPCSLPPPRLLMPMQSQGGAGEGPAHYRASPIYIFILKTSLYAAHTFSLKHLIITSPKEQNKSCSRHHGALLSKHLSGLHDCHCGVGLQGPRTPACPHTQEWHLPCEPQLTALLPVKLMP